VPRRSREGFDFDPWSTAASALAEPVATANGPAGPWLIPNVSQMKKTAAILSAILMHAAALAASSITLYPNGSVDSINLDLHVSKVERLKDGTLNIFTNGILEDQQIELTLQIDPKWEEIDTQKAKGSRPSELHMRFISTGKKSEALDKIARKCFHRESEDSLFSREDRQVWTVWTLVAQKEIESKRGEFSGSGQFGCSWLLGLDLPNRSLKIAVFESAGGRHYPLERIR
jgi:hypothetical protein